MIHTGVYCLEMGEDFSVFTTGYTILSSVLPIGSCSEGAGSFLEGAINRSK